MGTIYIAQYPHIVAPDTTPSLLFPHIPTTPAPTPNTYYPHLHPLHPLIHPIPIIPAYTHYLRAYTQYLLPTPTLTTYTPTPTPHPNHAVNIMSFQIAPFLVFSILQPRSLRYHGLILHRPHQVPINPSTTTPTSRPRFTSATTSSHTPSRPHTTTQPSRTHEAPITLIFRTHLDPIRHPSRPHTATPVD